MNPDIAGMVPKLPRGVRLRFDKTRDKWFLLGPERVFEPDEIAMAILKQVDGKLSLAGIVEALAALYGAPVDEIGKDVEDFIQSLLKIRMLELGAPPP
jgi:pyrroloquinoline quinone biosynthesis protein D